MKVGWDTKQLGDVCDVIGGGTPSKQVAAYYGGNIPWATVRDMRTDMIEQTEHSITAEALASSASNIIPAGNVVIATRVGLGKVCFLAQDTAINQDLRGIVPRDKKLSIRFLYHWLRFVSPQIVNEGTGATVQGVRLPFIKGLRIPLPPLTEQERIVALLDQAVLDIDLAIQNARRKIDASREAFSSLLRQVFATAWLSGRLGRLADIATDVVDGDHMPPPKSDSGVPFVTISNIDKASHKIDFTETYFVSRAYFDNLKPNRKPRRGDILYTVTGSFGIPVKIDDEKEFCFQRHIGLIRPRFDVSPTWLYFLLLSPQLAEQAERGATGTAQRTVSLSLLRSFTVPILPLVEQEQTAFRLEALRVKVKQFEQIQREKIMSLEALKQSLLHQAFSGHLVKERPMAIVIPFPIAIPNITATDIHAGILAIAYSAHERAAKASVFGHVKGEKIAHLVESWIGIDLARTPVRDAAGPNDFPHLKKIEHRANKANFFSVHRQADGPYKFTKRPGFDRLVERTRAALGDHNEKLDALLSKIVSWDSQTTEILATVFAAWNNLLIENQPITDEAIVLAARENWHPDKLNIKRERFFNAIEWMRKENIVPEGKGKRVIAKSS